MRRSPTCSDWETTARESVTQLGAAALQTIDVQAGGTFIGHVSWSRCRLHTCVQPRESQYVPTRQQGVCAGHTSHCCGWWQQDLRRISRVSVLGAVRKPLMQMLDRLQLQELGVLQHDVLWQIDGR